MVVDLKLQEEVTAPQNRYQRLKSDNDNASDAVLTQKEIHPLALEAAKRLINHYSAKTPVVIKSWGTAGIVYEELRETLINFGYRIDMAEDMAERLVDHAVDHAEMSRAKYNANIIALKIEVSKLKPEAQFETGALEVQRIDGITRHAQVAGATSIAIGINTGGTTVTALRDGVGEILQAISGSSNAVWVYFEAPNKSELEGVANEATMAAVVEIAGGGLSPEQAEVVMEKITMLVEAGLIAPEVAVALQNLHQIRGQAAQGNFDGIKALSQSIISDLSNAMDSGAMSADMVGAFVDALQLVSKTYGLQSVMDMKGLTNLKLEVLAVQGAKNVMGLLRDLQETEGLPPEISEILEQLDIDNLTVEQLQEALAGKGNSTLVDAVQNFIVQIQNPAVQAVLPSMTADKVTQFLSENKALVDAVTVKVTVSELSSAITDLDASSPEAMAIQEVIDKLEAGDFFETIDPALLQMVADKLEGVVVVVHQKVEAAQLIASVQSDPILMKNADVRQTVTQAVMRGIDTPRAVESVRASVALASYGANPVTMSPSFSPPAVVQQVSAIAANISKPTAVDKVTIKNLTAVAEAVEKFTGNPKPSINDIVNSVQRINTELGKVPPAEAAQLQALKDKFIQTLPLQVRQEQKSALDKSFSGNPDHYHASPELKRGADPDNSASKESLVKRAVNTILGLNNRNSTQIAPSGKPVEIGQPTVSDYRAGAEGNDGNWPTTFKENKTVTGINRKTSNALNVSEGKGFGFDVNYDAMDISLRDLMDTHGIDESSVTNIFGGCADCKSNCGDCGTAGSNTTTQQNKKYSSNPAPR